MQNHHSLDQLTPEELGKLFPIVIVPYDPAWPGFFRQEKETLQQLLGPELALRIEHFGSTAVPGLAAKPTIDILVEIPEGEAATGKIISEMTAAGYHFIPREDAPPPYPMFVKGYTPQGAATLTYHIHMAPAGHRGLWDRLLFRDYLIAHPEAAGEYEKLKRDLAERFTYDRDAYTLAKTAFVRMLTNKATGKP